MRLYFQNHVVLIELRKHGGDLALAVGVIQRLIDGGGRDSQPRSRLAIVHQARLQPQHLLIAGHVAQFGKLLQPGEQLGRIDVQFIRARDLPACIETPSG